MIMRLRIGTASWSDPGFLQDWYPAAMPKSQLLGWYAQQFDFVEVNSSFYSIPNARVVEGWCRNTPDDFLFDVKLFKLLSRHSTELKLLPPDLRARAGGGERAGRHPELDRLVAERFLREIQPLRRAGKLGALLLQLSPGFRPMTNRLEELEDLIGIFSHEKLAVELRHREWMTGLQMERTVKFFAQHGVTLVSVDAPASTHFTVMPFSEAVTQPALAYWRFHGRDEEAFVKGRTVADRFAYDYSREELEEIVRRIEAIAPKAQELHLVFNNNRSNFAPKAAAQLLELIRKHRALSRGLLRPIGPAKPPEQQNLF